MPFNIFQSSPQAIEEAKKPKVVVGRQHYPFDKLEPGQSFAVPMAEANVKSLRVRCGQLSKDGKQFTLVVHKETNVVEVARIS